MKRAVSISIGASKRDKAVEIELLGEKVILERIGTDGDMEKAARLYQEMDGVVDAFGVGGTDLGLLVNRKWYPLYSVASLTRFVKRTPIVDGNGLKTTLEKRAAQVLDQTIHDLIQPRRVLLCAGVDRWGMAEGFIDAGYETIFGDLLFTFGLPFPLHSPKSIITAARLLMPIAGRLPFSWVYPTGEEQEKRTPKWEKYFSWATVIAGDCHYITRYMPDSLPGKIIVTNTTTTDDVALFRRAGVRYLLTTTPVLDGRSFGTNMMEAAIIAACGRKESVDYSRPDSYLAELAHLVDRLNLQPQLQELN